MKFDNGEITFKDINTQYSSWMGNFYKYMSKNQRTKMNDLFNELFVNDFVVCGGNKYSKVIIAK